MKRTEYAVYYRTSTGGHNRFAGVINSALPIEKVFNIAVKKYKEITKLPSLTEFYIRKTKLTKDSKTCGMSRIGYTHINIHKTI